MVVTNRAAKKANRKQQQQPANVPDQTLGQVVPEKLSKVKALLVNCGGLVFRICVLILIALLSWKILTWATGCHVPVVVVLSQSMHPTYGKGDLLFIRIRKDDPVVKGDVVAFKAFERGRELEIYLAHRVIKVREHATRGWEILTQGDNNRVADSPLYASGAWLNVKDVIGSVYWSIPYMGWLTILTNQYPIPKYILVIVLGVFL